MSTFNAYQFNALSCAVIILSITGAVIIFVRSLSKRGASKRAVERLRNLPGGKTLAPPLAASPEIHLPVSGEAPPTLEQHTEPLEVQRTVNVSQKVSATVQPTPGRAEPLVTQALVRREAPQPGAKVRSFLEHAEPLEVQPAATRPKLPLPAGSRVWAVCKFGSVPKGTPGIVTGTTDGRFIWQSPMYLCTFADNRKVRARPKNIEAYNHAHSLQELEQPNLGAIHSRHMISRAQQLLSRQHPTHPAYAAKAKTPSEIAELTP
jgi:hypothetical protein